MPQAMVQHINGCLKYASNGLCVPFQSCSMCILLALELAFSHFGCTQSEKEKRDVVIEQQQHIASVYAASHGVVAVVVVVQVQCYYK